MDLCQKMQKIRADAIALLGNGVHVYIEPPSNVKMAYPAFVIFRSSGLSRFANNMPYKFNPSFDVTYISFEPDDPNVEKIVMGFPMIRLNRHFTSDDLHHDSFILYY